MTPKHKSLFFIGTPCMSEMFLMQGNFYQDDFPTNIVKGKICTMTLISINESELKDLSIKPKLLIITTCFLYGFAVIVAYRSSVKNSKYFQIPKIRRNLLRKQYIHIECFSKLSFQFGESRQGNLFPNPGGCRRPDRQCCGGVLLLQPAVPGVPDLVDLPLRHCHHLPASPQHMDLPGGK